MRSRNPRLNRNCRPPEVDGNEFEMKPRLTLCSHYVVASFLFVASILKLFAIVTGYTQLFVGLLPIWIGVVVVACELLVAWLLYSNHYPAMGSALGITMFATFAIVVVVLLMTGQTDCGCFGPLRVHAGFTLFLDLIALSILYCTRPNRLWATLQDECSRAGVRNVVTLVSGVCIASMLIGTTSGRELVGIPTNSKIIATGSVAENGKPGARVTVTVIARLSTRHVCRKNSNLAAHVFWMVSDSQIERKCRSSL